MPVTLLCTVRGCGLPLRVDVRRYVCAREHSFDVSRTGYVNLLQPQDRRSKSPGDSRAAVTARRRFLDRGLAEPLLRSMIELVRAHVPAEGAVLDIGCGEGHYLGAMAAALEADGYGVDISTPAIELAARRHCACKFVVANADRLLPFADDSFTLVMSITGRLNAAEIARVGRWALIAVAASDDLAELRGGLERDRVPRTLAMFHDRFELIEQRRAATVADLDEEAVRDILTATYRPREAGGRRVTLALDALLFWRRPMSPRSEGSGGAGGAQG